MYVLLDGNAIEGMAFLADIPDDHYELDPSGHYIRGRHTGRRYMLGDRVRVVVKKTNIVKRQIDFELVGSLNEANTLLPIGPPRADSRSSRGGRHSGTPESSSQPNFFPENSGEKKKKGGKGRNR
jgi:hypothetical protein